MLTTGHSLVVAALSFGGVLLAVRAAGSKQAEVGKRVEAILKQMTLEKIVLRRDRGAGCR
jgi:hypothetical protein